LANPLCSLFFEVPISLPDADQSSARYERRRSAVGPPGPTAIMTSSQITLSQTESNQAVDRLIERNRLSETGPTALAVW
jgi:hypothetical protein